jgi:LysM repeat protein
MNIESSSDRAKWKRSLIMKIGSAVIAIHVAVLCVFSLTQGCVTNESQGSGRGAGARHKGPWKHEHKTVETPASMVAGQGSYHGYDQGADDAALYAPVIIETQSTTIETYVGSSTPTEAYIVRKGDMISQLAVDFDTTTAELVRLNNLSNPDVLYVGQELRVPAGRGGKASSTSSSSAPSVKKGGTYTIQKGDTLSGIAVAAGVSINDLRSLNNIQGDMIRAGETLDIPASGKVPTNTQKVTGTKTADPQVEPAPAAAALAAAPLAAVGTEPEVAPVESVDMIEEYVFYPGDSLDEIAQKYGVGKAEIMRLNNITDETQIQNGQRLRIPIAE